MSRHRLLNIKDHPLIKVCGITRMDDALSAIESGANALGFNFYPQSSRFLDFQEAERIVNGLPGGILAFGVVVHGFPPNAAAGPATETNTGMESENSDEYNIPEFIDIVQIHGIQEASQVSGSVRPVLVAVSPDTAPQFKDYDIIIDTSWGEGKLADWEKTSKLTRPYILSGGLNPGNIEEALESLDPAGIDVCSGIESSPGRKDYVKMKAFLEKTNAFYRKKQRSNK